MSVDKECTRDATLRPRDMRIIAARHFHYTFASLFFAPSRPETHAEEFFIMMTAPPLYIEPYHFLSRRCPVRQMLPSFARSSSPRRQHYVITPDENIFRRSFIETLFIERDMRYFPRQRHYDITAIDIDITYFTPRTPVHSETLLFAYII
jgi:hypothetical protein